MKMNRTLTIIGALAVLAGGAVATRAQNLLINGDFMADAAEFTTWPGYTTTAGNTNDITAWYHPMGGGYGLNGGGVNGAGNPFGPVSDGGLTYAFLQGGPSELAQDLTNGYNPGVVYQLDFDAAARAGNTVTFQLQIADNSQTNVTTQVGGIDLTADPNAFVHYTYLFVAPPTFDGTPSIQLYNLSTGDNTINFAEVSLQVATNALLITQQPTPASLSLYLGGTATFTVVATGTNTVSYQWRKNGSKLSDGGSISGTTTPSLTINNVSAGDAGSYDVVVSLGSNSLTSQAATLTVSVAIFSQQTTPAAMMLYPGRTASFTAVVQGTGTTYQWQKNGSALSDGGKFSGTTTTNLVISNVSAGEVGSYDVVATVPAGSVISQAAPLGVVALPAAGTYAASVVSQNPMGYWRFSEGGGTNAFDYIAGNNGVDPLGSPLQAGPRPPAFAGFESANTASHMNGTNQGYASTSQMFNNLSEFTLMGWFNIDPAHYPLTNNAAGRASLFGQQWTAELSFYEGTNLYFYSAGITPGTIFVTNEALFAPGVWHFLAAVSDPTASATTIYLDGVAVASADACPGTTQPYFFSIGDYVSNFPTVPSSFPGSIDEVAAFDHALSASTIQALYITATGVSVSIQREAGGVLQVSWTGGHLESATSISGPWQTESSATASPWTVTPGGAMKFYRAVWP
jgi:hypothetical protein